MIVVTGGAGFIGSAFLGHLISKGYTDLVAVDDFSREDKTPNLKGKMLSGRVDRKDFFPWLRSYSDRVQCIVHLGARTDTTEQDEDLLEELNTSFTQKVWKACIEYGLPMVYASSAATYGNGEHGYEDTDTEDALSKLSPLNPYGDSKHAFDLWAVAQEKAPYFWMGFKFFNVYGPNEYHKGRMASVVLHGYEGIKNREEMTLFRSHKEGVEDGHQSRDFVYVKDVCEVLQWAIETRPQAHNGIYNLGSGVANTFLDLANATFSALGKKPKVNFIDTPKDIRENYQYYTCAPMDKLKGAGYEKSFTPLKEGVKDYVQNYLLEKEYL